MALIAFNGRFVVHGGETTHLDSSVTIYVGEYIIGDVQNSDGDGDGDGDGARVDKDNKFSTSDTVVSA